MNNVHITAEDWLTWRDAYTMLPYAEVHPLPRNYRAVTWETAWRESDEHAFVLESGKDGRYTYLGVEAASALYGYADGAARYGGDGARPDGACFAVIEGKPGEGSQPRYGPGQPLDAVRQWMAPHRSPRVEGLPKWSGGIVGYWGYDVARTIERLPAIALADSPCPDYYFMRVDKLWVIDHADDKLYCIVHRPVAAGASDEDVRRRYEEAKAAAESMKIYWDRITAPPAASDPAGLRSVRLREDIAAGRIQIDIEAMDGVLPGFSKDGFMAAVRRIQNYIRQGDVFQVNLSVRQSRRIEAEPEEIYEWLRCLNPSPYMAFMKFPGFRLVCGSPELLVELRGERVRTRPIGGTRPRGRTPEEDEAYREELLANDKERAEHIMLVDLERNDLGRISRFGTVRVDELMTVERYSHVMHLVSEVTGELEPGRSAFDVIAAAFPGGTITGAPKVRTMEIIEELEPTRRGPYTGSLGWIDYNGDMEFNIIIRTLLASGGIASVQAGAGIVIDSDAEKEYAESLNKAKALWKAVQYAENAKIGQLRGMIP